MNTTCTADIRVFLESMRAIARVPGRHGADVTNASVMKVIIGSGGGPGIVQLTPKAEKQDILNDLTQNGLVYRLAARALQRKPFTGSRKKALEKMVNIIIAARIRSRGFIAASWLVCARKLRRYVKGNLNRLGNGLEVRDKGEAATSFVIPASGQRLTGGAFSTADGAKKVSSDALIQAAVDYATHDNLEYVRRKFGSAISDAIGGGRSVDSVLP